MQLIPESSQAFKMWSIRLAITSAALGALEATLPLWENDLPGGVFAGLSSAVAVAAAVARVIRQKNIA